MPRTVAMVVSAGKATLRELSTVYGLEDLHDMIEIIQIDAHNRALVAKRAAEQMRREG